MNKIFSTYTKEQIPIAYEAGVLFGKSELKSLGFKVSQGQRDVKAIDRLIRDMRNDFKIAIDQGKERFITYIEFSKQGKITESQISQAVGKGYLTKGTGKESKKLLGKLFKETEFKTLDETALEKSIARRLMGENRRLDRLNITDEFRNLLKEKFEKTLKEKKFLQIYDKNGDIITFQIDKYSDLVSRTRLGDAQVAGTIKIGNENGISEYQVTDHNTTTKICIPFEGKIYTTNPSNKKFEMLTDRTTPLYHVNCKHRLKMRAFTKTQLSKMPDVR
ncbi:MAG: phage minor capsid protein [Leptospiraceae bacterium]|nr:phage minor capsid protein [Leptospiraceae bacterium]